MTTMLARPPPAATLLSGISLGTLNAWAATGSGVHSTSISMTDSASGSHALSTACSETLGSLLRSSRGDTFRLKTETTLLCIHSAPFGIRPLWYTFHNGLSTFCTNAGCWSAPLPVDSFLRGRTAFFSLST